MKYVIYIVAAVIIVYFFGSVFMNIYSAKKRMMTKKPIKAVPNLVIKPTGITPKSQQGIVQINGKKYFINPSKGNDKNNGMSESNPLMTIQKAVNVAMGGDTIFLMPGTYYQDIITVRDGLSNQPIVIKGTRAAVVKGGGSAHVVEINHSNIRLEGFTVDGHYKDSFEKKSFRDKLVYVTSQVAGMGIDRFSMFDMDIKNAGGECVRLRYFVTNSEIARNNISTCGVADFSFNDGGKNGEGIYIGTAPEQRNDGKNPTSEVDQSNNNWIHHNDFNTKGNECVDIKEGSSNNIVEYNNCTGQSDPESGGFDSRGNNNIFRLNTIYDNIGVGVRLGGDSENDGIGNDVYDNVIINNKSGGIKFQRSPQGKVCNNSVHNNEKGTSVGTFGRDFSPEAACK